jgi:hypothetical protein
MMFNTTLPPSPQLAAAAAEPAAANAEAQSSSKSRTIWQLATTANTSAACNTCYLYLHLHLKLHRGPMTSAEVQSCVTCLEAADVFQEARLLLLSKAAAVHFHDSHASGQRICYNTYRLSDCHACMYCMGWTAQHPYQGSHGLNLSVPLAGGKVSKLRKPGACDNCAGCLGDVSTADDTMVALHRVWVHYYMAILLFDVRLEAPGAWLVAAEGVYQEHHKHDDRLIADGNADVGQDVVLLSPKDLHDLHNIVDSDLEMVLQEFKQQQAVRLQQSQQQQQPSQQQQQPSQQQQQPAIDQPHAPKQQQGKDTPTLDQQQLHAAKPPEQHLAAKMLKAPKPIIRNCHLGVNFSRLAAVGPFSDFVDCIKCKEAVEKLHQTRCVHLPYTATWVPRRLLSCYRCKTSPYHQPHPWPNQKPVDYLVAQLLYDHYGMPTPSCPARCGVQLNQLAPCSVADCKAWIANHPVLEARTCGSGLATAGLQSCYACQRNYHQWSATEDVQPVHAQRIYADLANLMFNTTLPPSPQLAAAAAAKAATPAAAAAKTRRNTTAWQMASSAHSSTACYTCYYDLHLQVVQPRARVMRSTQVRNCVACLTATDLHQDAQLALLSKAAAVYFKRRVANPGLVQRLFGVELGMRLPYEWADCRYCMGWIAQQPRQTSSVHIQDFVIPFHGVKRVMLSTVGGWRDCVRCLNDSSTDDDNDQAVVRTRVNYDMASLLFQVQLPPPAWLAPANVVIQEHWELDCDHMHNSSTLACVGSRTALDAMVVAQRYVLFSPKDLHNVHAFLDSRYKKKGKAVVVPVQTQASTDSHSTAPSAWYSVSFATRVPCINAFAVELAYASICAAAVVYALIVMHASGVDVEWGIQFGATVLIVVCRLYPDHLTAQDIAWLLPRKALPFLAVIARFMRHNALLCMLSLLFVYSSPALGDGVAGPPIIISMLVAWNAVDIISHVRTAVSKTPDGTSAAVQQGCSSPASAAATAAAAAEATSATAGQQLVSQTGMLGIKDSRSEAATSHSGPNRKSSSSGSSTSSTGTADKAPVQGRKSTAAGRSSGSSSSSAASRAQSALAEPATTAGEWLCLCVAAGAVCASRVGSCNLSRCTSQTH